jgi:hypothetical protein
MAEGDENDWQELHELFVHLLGDTPLHAELVSDEVYARFEPILNPGLLRVWREYGLGGYGNGLVWLVNPDDHRDTVDAWIAGSALEGLDTYHTIAISAFGKYHVMGQRSDNIVSIQPCLGMISGAVTDLSATFEDRSLPRLARRWFVGAGALKPKRFDIESVDTGGSLFDECVQAHGQLEPGEVYGFEPPLFAGGKETAKQAARLRRDVHIDILLSLYGQPRFFNLDTFPG